MTKEKLYDLILQNDRYSSSDYMEFVKHCMDEFFDQNVVIPKGENRHQNADVFHEWAENPNLNIQYLWGPQFGDLWEQWCSLGLSCKDQYRIKPSEPMHEAIVRIHYADGTYEDTQKYFTYEEFENFGFPKSCTWVESTKRERKQ